MLFRSKVSVAVVSQPHASSEITQPLTNNADAPIIHIEAVRIGSLRITDLKTVRQRGISLGVRPSDMGAPVGISVNLDIDIAIVRNCVLHAVSCGDVECHRVPRNMFTDDKLENLQKLIEGKQMLFKHAFRAEQLEVVITQNQVSFPWFPLASEPDAVSAYTEFITKLCGLAIKLKRVSLKDKEVENEK